MRKIYERFSLICGWSSVEEQFENWKGLCDYTMAIYDNVRAHGGAWIGDRGVCPFFSSLGSGKPRGDVKYVSCENERDRGGRK